MSEVENWLSSLSLQDHTAIFAENGVSTMEDLASLTDADLKELGVSKLMDRKKLVAAIVKLKAPVIPIEEPVIPVVAEVLPPKQKKTLSLLFIGETGAGKTTLINSFYFYAQNKPLDEIEALVKTKYLPGKTAGSESNTANQNQSQTTRADIHSFTIATETVEYEVKVMDTPGLGDTRGITQDDANISTIVSTVEKTPELNAIFLILNGAQARLTSHIEYVIQKLKGMLPNVFRDNLFLILTNSPIAANLVLEKELLDVPEDRKIPIDNSIFSVDIKKASAPLMIKIKTAWTGMRETIAYILESASQFKGVKTDAFQIIREKRDTVNTNITELQNKTEALTKRQMEMRELQEDISATSAGADALKKIQEKSKVEVIEVVFTDTSYHNTICRACDYTKHSNPQCCHEHCGLTWSGVEGDNIFKSCAAINGETCVLPQCGHSYTRHVHVKKKPVVEKKIVDNFTEEQLRELNSLSSAEEAKKYALRMAQENLDNLEADKKKVATSLVECFAQLRDVCSDFNYQREVDLSIQLVEEKLDTSQDQNEKTKLRAVVAVFKAVRKVITETIDTAIDGAKKLLSHKV